MGRRSKFLIVFLFLAGAFFSPLAFSLEHADRNDTFPNNVQTDQSAKDVQTVVDLLKAGKLQEALALINKVIVQAEGEGGAAGMEAKGKPGQLKKIFPSIKLARMGFEYFLRAGIQMALLDWDPALADYDLALAVAPEPFAEYLAGRGNCHRLLEEYDLAVADYSAALKAKFMSPGPNDQDSAAIYKGRAHAFWDQDKYNQALADLDQAIRLTPLDRTLYEDRIHIWEGRGDYQKAVGEVSRLIRLEPNDAKLYVDRAGRYESLQEWDNALKDYAIVLNLTQDKETKLRALERRATIFDVQTSGGQDRNAEAEAEYTALLKLDPGNTQWLSSRARARLRKGDSQGAFADYAECLKRAPGKGWPYRLRGEAYYDLGNYDQAIKDFNQALKLDPADATTNYFRGRARAGQNDLQGAIADYNIALKKFPQTDFYYEARGRAYWALGEDSKAIQDITSALDLKPKEPYYRYLRGNYFLGLNKYDQALVDYNKVLELDPGYTAALGGIADIALFTGDYKKAYADYTTFLKSFPKSSMAYYRRGQSSFALGDELAAVADYKKAVELDPKYKDAFNTLAWLLATSPRSGVRNGSQAVEYGKKALELAGQNDPGIMDTLAAALAETGHYEDAASLEKMAISLLSQDFDPQERANWQARLALYQQGKPYREKR